MSRMYKNKFLKKKIEDNIINKNKLKLLAS